MSCISKKLLIISFLLCVSASCTSAEWELRGRPSPQEIVNWRVDLIQRESGLQWLENMFHAVSTPSHKLYGEHVSVNEIMAHVAPDEKDINSVLEWISSAGQLTAKLSVTGDFIFVSGTVAATESLFGGSLALHSFGHSKKGLQIIRSSTEAAIPFHLKHIVRTFGLLDTPPPASVRHFSEVSKGQPGINIDPTVIASTIGMGAPQKFTSSETSQAVAEFEEGYFYPSDLILFQQTHKLPVHNITKIVGGNDPLDGYLAEATLDVEYIQATGPGIDTWDFYQDAFDLTQWAQTVLATPNVPMVQSISWGSGEQAFKLPDMQRDNVEFQKMGALGMTVLIASGDGGTGNSGIFKCKEFAPIFPATSPYVTAVGGTSLSSLGGTQDGWPSSGGGFSSVFPRPTYQDDAVKAYLSNSAVTLPPQQYWNNTGRAFPDLAFAATNYQTIIQNISGTVSGTSAAAPVVAGLIATLNGLRSQAGGKPVGFINPALYSAAAGVGVDVTTGNNKKAPCKAGFAATTGWDPVTGLGAPTFEKMKAIFLKA